MKLKNIYSMAMILSLFLGIFPLISLISANILGHIVGCGPVINTEILDCKYSEVLSDMVRISWYWVISVPVGIVFFIVFNFLYLTARSR